MFEKYIPEKFCREFVEVKKQSGQLPMIMAVVKGIKPCMDDWIHVDQYSAYCKVCRRYGLLVRPDAVFQVKSAKDIPESVIGRDRLTTTKAFGFPFSGGPQRGTVHVFIARTKKALDAAFHFGWYPLIVGGRLIDRPLIDAFRFGDYLGYPHCCVEYFRRFNNWFRYSYLFESLRNTDSSRFSFLCNPFLKDVLYSYIYHMPCSYDCFQTAEQAGHLRQAINEEEPELVAAIDRHLKLPLLVFYERKIYAFEGTLRGGCLSYKEVYFVGAMPENNVYEDVLREGDAVRIEGSSVLITKKGRLHKKITVREETFAPEKPFLIQFS